MLAIVLPWVVYIAVNRVARRALPLAALLKMTLVFPDHAPSRLAVARKAGSTRSLARQLEQPQALDAEEGLSLAAERILALATSLSKHDRMTRGHSERVRALTDLIAEQMKLPAADRNRLRWASLLHDIGKLSVPASVLNKSGKPDAEEWQTLLRHPLEGKRLVAPLADWLGIWAATVPEHHERYDGSGYPRGLVGEQISPGGRIVAVADSYDAMTSARSYSKAMTPAAARQELTACAGSHFDPVVIRAFLEVSVGRLSVVGGPLAWLGEFSALNGAPQLGQAIGTAGSAFAGFAAAAVTVMALALGAHHLPAHTNAVEVSSAQPAGPSASTTVPDPSPRFAIAQVGSAQMEQTSPPAAPPGSASGGRKNGPPPVAAPDPAKAPSSPASGTVTPATLPGAPTIVSATAGNASATLTWSAPSSDGGSAITAYTVVAGDETTPANGGESCTWTSGPLTCTVTGLTNGDAYVFTVSAANGVGTGPSSPASGTVTPATLPGAPTIVSATAGNASATLTWSAPSSDGGSAITAYTVVAGDETTPANGGESCTWTSGPLTCTVTGLTNGDAYVFTVSAANGVGTGPSSPASGTVTPATLPGAPTIVSATAGNASATLTWSAPSSDGGSAITAYTVVAGDETTPANGGESCTWTSGPLTCTVTGLTNGDAYVFTVSAANGVGTGPSSPASGTVTPATLPGAPTIVSATAGNASATLTWSAPSSDGGSAITAYTVVAGDETTPANGGESCTWTSGPLTCTVTGLTNGDAYVFTVSAANGVGTGPSSPASGTVTPATLPGAPTIVSATAGNASATLTWSAPSSDGGSAITAYTVVAGDETTPANGGESCTWTSGPLTCTVTGLTNGDAYVFTVSAANGVGTGPSSPASGTVTPATLPGAPTIVSATAGNASATLTWSAPSSDGGSAITAYTVVAGDETTPANGGESCTWTSGPLTCTVTGLTNGDAYVFTVSAANGVGTGPSSPASGTVTPATLPGAPTIVSATAGNASATLTWSAPSSDGGSAITAYTVVAGDETTPANGGESCTWTSGPLTCTVTGLTNGDAYVFTVSAANGVGTGPSSPASGTVTPATLPGAPTIVSATAGNASATLTWSAPSSDGGSAITAYTVVAGDETTPANGGESCTWTSGPLTCTVTGLTNGDAYVFTVSAANGVGTGPSSPASGTVTPATLPGAPTIVSATAGNASATLTWSAPSSDGGSAITAYTVVAGDETTPANGGESCTWTSGPLTCTVTGLTNGDAYVFTVSAANGVGTGLSSPASGTVTPATLPGAPTSSRPRRAMPVPRSPGALRPLTAGQRSPPTRWWRATRPPRPTAVSRALGRAVRSPARSRV